jgi:hypothetical protein
VSGATLLLDCAVVFGTELLLEVLAFALAGDEDGSDDDERGHDDNDGYQDIGVHLLLTSGR